MPLDAVCLRAVITELNNDVCGAKIEKIYQPERDEIVILLRSFKGAKKLLITANPQSPRIHFIETNRENPANPPMFCMLMRKHLHGARIVSINQPDMERIAVIDIDATDELGTCVKRQIVCEFMGRHSNIILKDENERIIDAIHRIDGDISGKRQVLPGLFYRSPPPQEGKLNPIDINGDDLIKFLDSAEQKNLDKFLLSKISGFSPLICREIAYCATGDTGKNISNLCYNDKQNLKVVFDNFKDIIKNKKFKANIIVNTENKSFQDFTFMNVKQYENIAFTNEVDSFSNMLVEFYEKKSNLERMKRRCMDLKRTVSIARDRLFRKLNIQREELEQTKDREKHKKMGELIAANYYQLEKGMDKARVVDYYDENCQQIEIKLDIMLTPQQNAQKYFKLYQKAKTAEKILKEQIANGEADLLYLDSVLQLIDEAENEKDLLQFREELVQTGFLSQNKSKKKMQKSQSMPFEYRTSDGFCVLAGKNNIQNDMLRTKIGYKNDIWFHTQKIHGSHVILCLDGKEPTDIAMTEAAKIAAYHSKAKNSSMVAVDYTQLRNLKKPNGSKPGFVIYNVYQTAYVTPVENEIEKLRII